MEAKNGLMKAPFSCNSPNDADSLRYRYVERRDGDSKQVVSRELYDRESDRHEARNAAAQSEYARAVGELSAMLECGCKSVLPGIAE